jgi:hypothetical protein
MSTRCPDAEPICRLMLKGWRLVFRGVADVVPQRGAVCPGGVWRITDDDERRLDVYEGVKGGLYRKVYLPIATFEGQTSMLMYVMNSEGVYPPSQAYLDGIIDGYRHFKMDDKARRLLDEALNMAWDDKRPSHREHARNWRKGYPKLARPKHCNNCGFCVRPKGFSSSTLTSATLAALRDESNKQLRQYELALKKHWR